MPEQKGWKDVGMNIIIIIFYYVVNITLCRQTGERNNGKRNAMELRTFTSERTETESESAITHVFFVPKEVHL